jgi:uncharacterized alpha-E superfamily protein
LTENRSEETVRLLEALLQPWHSAVENPEEAQSKVLDGLLVGYARTDYGTQHGAAQMKTVNL